MTGPQFCSLCDVSLDLHDGPDSCDLAETKAHLLEMYPLGSLGVRR